MALLITVVPFCTFCIWTVYGSSLTPRHQVKKFLLFGQPLGFLKKSAQKGWLKIRNRAFRFLENMNQSMFDRLESLLNPVDAVGSFCVSSSGLTS